MANKKFNIMVFCAYFYPHEGGVERFVGELFSNLKNIRVTIVTANTENAKSFEESMGFRIFRLPCWHLLGKTYPVIKPSGKKILEKLDNEYFDYVFTNTRFFNTTLLGYSYAKRRGIPLIHIEHGTNHSKLTNPVSRLISIIYDHTIGRHIIKNCARLVAISNAAAEFSRHIYNRPSVIVRNSIDTKNFQRLSQRQIMRIKGGLSIKNQKIIVYVGRLIFAKGVQDLLETTKDIKNLKIVIVGDGNYRERLEKISKNAIFVGRKSQDDIKNYLSIADLFVNPSYAEGLPTSVLEAGVIGIPVIATDVGGTNEIIDDGKNGFLIRPCDSTQLRSAIDILLYDEEKSRIFAQALQKKIGSEFDWTSAKKQLKKLVKFK